MKAGKPPKPDKLPLLDPTQPGIYRAILEAARRERVARQAQRLMLAAQSQGVRSK